MKALKVWLLILSLVSYGLILPVKTTYADTEVDNPELFEATAEGDRAVEEMLALSSLYVRTSAAFGKMKSSNFH